MMELNIEQARTNMIKQQLRTWDVFDEAVLEVISGVPRERFVPQRYHNLAFVDMELPLGHSQVMMNPKVEGRMLQALDIQNTEQVLEIGTGSGFITACLARLGQNVETIDIFDELSVTAKQKRVRMIFASARATRSSVTVTRVQSASRRQPRRSKTPPRWISR